jgi:hypothetical protein
MMMTAGGMIPPPGMDAYVVIVAVLKGTRKKDGQQPAPFGTPINLIVHCTNAEVSFFSFLHLFQDLSSIFDPPPP